MVVLESSSDTDGPVRWLLASLGLLVHVQRGVGRRVVWRAVVPAQTAECSGSLHGHKSTSRKSRRRSDSASAKELGAEERHRDVLARDLRSLVQDLQLDSASFKPQDSGCDLGVNEQGPVDRPVAVKTHRKGPRERADSESGEPPSA